MEKRLLLAIALSFALLLIWNLLFAPPPKPPPAPAPPSASSPSAGPTPSPSRETPPAVPEEPPPGPVPGGEAVQASVPQEQTVETDLYRIRFTNRGAHVVSWQLKNYQDDGGQPLELVSPGASKVRLYPLQIDFGDEAVTGKIHQALFQTEVGPGIHGQGTRIRFQYADGDGLAVTKVLDLAEDSYVGHLEVQAYRERTPLEGRVVWGAGLGPDPGFVEQRNGGTDFTRAVLFRNGKIVRVTRQALKDQPSVREEGMVAWAGLEDHYFACLFLPVQGSTGASVAVHEVIEEGREREFLSLGLDLATGSHYDLYVGPKDYDLLSQARIGVEGIVDFGFFGAIARFLFMALKFINRYVGNWGWSIILLTGLIRVAFFPLTQKGMVSMRRTQEKMKKVQPKMQAIRERFKKLAKKDMSSRQKMNDEIMKLYQKEGINPLGGMTGCLPLLLQLPILWGFYNLLNVAIELRHAPFAFWIQDLSKKDPYYVTPIIMGVTMLIQQMMTSNTIPDPAQRRIMMLMPVIFTWFFKDFPSGLVLYWLVNNILAIGQQYLINTQAARQSARDQVTARG